MPEDRDRHLRPVQEGSYVRTAWFWRVIDDLKKDIGDLKTDQEKHEEAHAEEDRWRRRLIWASILAPLIVGVMLALFAAALAGKGA